MWIAIGILGCLAALICVILLLPVRVILKNDDQNALLLRYKFLFKTYGDDPSPDSSIVQALKTATGADRLDKKQVQTSIQTSGLKQTVTDSYDLLSDLIKEVVRLLRLCVLTRLQVTIRCAGDGADEAAIAYGESCAATYGLLHLLKGFLRIRKRSVNIDIGCDFLGTQSLFRYEVELTTRVHRVLGALWKVVMAETRRTKAQQK